MSLLELACFIIVVVLVLLCSSGLGHFLHISEAIAVIPVVGLVAVLLRVLGRIPYRRLSFISLCLVLTTFCSMGLGHISGLRDSIFVRSSVAVFLFILLITIQAKVLAWRQEKAPTTDKGGGRVERP
jgi:hypothetical protein